MRDIPVGNGSLLVNFDDKYQIRDIYFPRVGQENHTEGSPFRFGIWADGQFSWIADDGWKRELRYLPETLVTDVVLANKELDVTIRCNDTVASHDNIFLRRVTVTNNSKTAREFRVFFHHDFRINENKVADTAYFEPESASLIHYQKRRYFLINTEPAFSSFATGRKDFQGQEGTWRDAEDGVLNGGAITEGSVDSTIGVHFSVDGGAEYEFYYWMAAGVDNAEVQRLDRQIRERTPQRYLDYTGNYWRAWVNKNDTDLSLLPEKISEQLKRSLLIVHTQIDNDGAILAANDWEVTLRSTDHYSYLWTRDGAFVANALDIAGYSHITRKFFDFCARIVHPNGYFLQKYNSDGTVASGWHAAWDPYTQTPLVPIQEDETALVLWALWEHYERYRDIEFAHRLYRRLTIPCAEFMASFVHEDLRLPKPSWNLWEDRRGIHTFTVSTVIAGLRAAAKFADLFAESERAESYREHAEEFLASMKKHLYSAVHGRFLRSLQFHGDDNYDADATVDASLFAVFYLGGIDAADPMAVSTMKAVEEKLTVGGGIARFENDGYMRTSPSTTGNPWFICTLWLAEYYLARATTTEELVPAAQLLEWVADNALASGVLAEQLDPLTGGPVSVSPLTWSHSTFVAAALHYNAKLRAFSAATQDAK